MTQAIEEMIKEEKLVVFFDICSSSNILEDLILSGNLKLMRILILALRSFLKSESAKKGFDVYKFIGDGWVLLFPPSVSGEALVSFLEKLCQLFKYKINTHVVPHLQTPPSVMGLTFGVDQGELVRFRMKGNDEYIGRPLNIASRLQGSIKQKDHNPGYKVLFSKPCFQALKFRKGFRKCKPATRELRNIHGGKRYGCIKMNLRH
jgi:class 3 adenylate cyclase